MTEVYQTESFTVPAVSGSRLIFSADYPNTSQTSLLHFALFEPDGSYAAYSDPQGLADYAEVEVADPPAGRWTALFFTEQNGATKGGKGTKGTVQWDASTWRNTTPASPISPSSLSIGAGRTATATITVTNPQPAGDTDESVVVSSSAGQTTVPVTIRTMVAIGAGGGTFQGVLTGGNGRDGSDAQTNTYFFDVPASKTDLAASVALRTDPDEVLVCYLIGPDGQTVGYSSNYTEVPKSTSDLKPGSTRYLQTFAVGPPAGEWELVLDWENPVTGKELTEDFSGAIRFNQAQAFSQLPDSPSTLLLRGQPASLAVALANSGVAPEAYFVDPRLDQTTTLVLKNLNTGTSAGQLHLPARVGQAFPLGTPIYLVPSGTSRLNASVSRLTGTGRVSFALSPLNGDPEVSPGVPATGLTTSGTPTSESLQLSEPELTPGLWALSAAEVGPARPGALPRDGGGEGDSGDPGFRHHGERRRQRPVGGGLEVFPFLLPGAGAEHGDRGHHHAHGPSRHSGLRDPLHRRFHPRKLRRHQGGTDRLGRGGRPALLIYRRALLRLPRAGGERALLAPCKSPFPRIWPCTWPCPRHAGCRRSMRSTHRPPPPRY